MKTTNDNKIRKKIDGFILDENNNDNLENRFITTDQGVYSEPDENFNPNNKKKK